MDSDDNIVEWSHHPAPLRRQLNLLRVYIKEGWSVQADRLIDEIYREHGVTTGTFKDNRFV